MPLRVGIIDPKYIQDVADVVRDNNGKSETFKISDIPSEILGLNDKFISYVEGTLSEISNTVVSLYSYAFYCCSALTTVNLPAATTIGDGAFQIH